MLCTKSSRFGLADEALAVRELAGNFAHRSHRRKRQAEEVSVDLSLGCKQGEHRVPRLGMRCMEPVRGCECGNSSAMAMSHLMELVGEARTRRTAARMQRRSV